MTATLAGLFSCGMCIEDNDALKAPKAVSAPIYKVSLQSSFDRLAKKPMSHATKPGELKGANRNRARLKEEGFL
ncbi:MAG: hypothetical protein J0H48_03050 [Nitrosospira multiformis]|nr:hypothetical protein [Nitrosospira multiformis]